jgi:hypothetical protein
VNDAILAYFITWTCYGTYLPSDSRGWTKWHKGDQLPQPRLEEWCQAHMTESPLYLDATQREIVEDQMAEFRQLLKAQASLPSDGWNGADDAALRRHVAGRFLQPGLSGESDAEPDLRRGNFRESPWLFWKVRRPAAGTTGSGHGSRFWRRRWSNSWPRIDRGPRIAV